MKSLTPSLRIGILKGISTKMRSPEQEAESLKAPQLANPLNARLERKVDPDYMPHRKYNLTNKLFKS